MDRHGNAYSQDYLNQSDLSNRMASMGIGNGAPTSNLNQSNAPPSFHSHGLEVRGPGYAGNGGMPGNPLPVSAYEYMNEKSYPTPPQRFPQHQMNPMNPRGVPRPFVNGQSNIHQIRGNSGTSSPPQFVGSFDGGAGGSPGNVPPSKSTTLFVGDLSVLCDEEKLFDLFHTFGKIESIQLKKSDIDHQRAHLSYGFIKFFTHEAAATALDQLNGMPYLGRNLRVGWADDHPANHYAHTKPVINTVPPKKNNPTAQIHVTFVSKNVHQPISELDLRNIFERFGNVVDVAIKKSVFNKELGIQSGYGFIHFSLTDEGIQSALAAVDEVNHTVINFISFECTVTHGLKTYLFSLRSRGGGGGGVGGAMGSGGGAPQVGAFNTYNSNSNGNAGGGGGKMMRDVDRLPSAYYAAPPQPPMAAQNFGAPLPLVMPPPHVAQYSQQQPYPATQYPNRGGGGSYSPPPNRNMQAHDFMRETQQLPQHAYYPSSSMSSMTNEGGVPSSFNQTSSPNSASTSTYSILNNNVPYTSSVLTTSSNSTYDMNNITVVEERRPVVDFDDIIESSFEKPTKMSSVTQKKLVLETEGLLSPNQDNQNYHI